MDETMQCLATFGRFVALNELDRPDLLVRMTKGQLPVDGERYGVVSRLIARPAVSVNQLAAAAIAKALGQNGLDPSKLAALVLSSRVANVQEESEAVARELGMAREQAVGIERACSGFPAATEIAVKAAGKAGRPVALAAAEVISRSINWEPLQGDPADHSRARGQASKLFADGAAATVVHPAGQGGRYRILRAWAGEVADEMHLIQKTAVTNSVDPWGSVRPGATECISMPGRRGWHLLKTAPRIMVDAIGTALESSNCIESHWGQSVLQVVHHQANGLMVRELKRLLTETPWGKGAHVWDCIRDMGNTVSATIPTVMAQIQDQLPPGALVAMPSAGAGGPGYRPDVLSTGCVLVRITAPPRDTSIAETSGGTDS